MLGLLPQTPVAPTTGITVADLVSRWPATRGWFRHWSAGDEAAVTRCAGGHRHRRAGRPAAARAAVRRTRRQRVWIAMALARGDRPAAPGRAHTYLDTSVTRWTCRLLRTLNRDTGRTIVSVLHDLNLACRYSDHLVVMAGGSIPRRATGRGGHR